MPRVPVDRSANSPFGSGSRNPLLGHPGTALSSSRRAAPSKVSDESTLARSQKADNSAVRNKKGEGHFSTRASLSLRSGRGAPRPGTGMLILIHSSIADRSRLNGRPDSVVKAGSANSEAGRSGSTVSPYGDAAGQPKASGLKRVVKSKRLMSSGAMLLRKP